MRRIQRHVDDSENEQESKVSAPRPPETSLLRIIADDYDQAQRNRVARGEQIRAIAQGRDQQSAMTYLEGLGFVPVKKGDVEVKSAADRLLESILKGETAEPNEYLSRTYRQSWMMERAAYNEMGGELEKHPAWEWMRQVRGVGPTLGAKLLSRLDIEKANNPSSFVLYCGLSTVPGQRWECETCGYVGIYPATHEVTGKHKGCKELARLTHVNPDLMPARFQPTDRFTVSIGDRADSSFDLIQSAIVHDLESDGFVWNPNDYDFCISVDSNTVVRVAPANSNLIANLGKWSDDPAKVSEKILRALKDLQLTQSSAVHCDIRAAQPRSERGQKRSYDAFAKKTMYLLASSFLKAGANSFYNRVYRDEIAKYERDTVESGGYGRDQWEKGRKHYAALRVVQKMFLSHLYEAWCLAIGIEPKEPYVKTYLGHQDMVGCMEVLEWERRVKEKAA